MTGSQIWQQWNLVFLRAQFWVRLFSTSMSPKTNWMLVCTPQMVRYHSVEERKLPITCGDTPLKRISCTKLLGVHVDQHLNWKTHVDHVLSSLCGTLSVLRRLKNLAPFHMRKHLAESSVLSKWTLHALFFNPFQHFKWSASTGYKMHVLDLSQEGSQDHRSGERCKVELASSK